MFRDRNHLMKLLKQDLGVYSIKLPVSDKELFEDVIRDKTLMVFGIYSPRRYLFRGKLSEMKTPLITTSSETGIISDPSAYIFKFPSEVLGETPIISIDTITPFNRSNMMGK